MNKEKLMKLVKICERAEREYPTITKWYGKRVSRLMD